VTYKNVLSGSTQAIIYEEALINARPNILNKIGIIPIYYL